MPIHVSPPKKKTPIFLLWSVPLLTGPDIGKNKQPFRSQWPVNPSWEIAKSLPSHLPAPSASSASSSASPDKQEQNESADDNDNDGDDFTNGRIGRSTTTAKTEVNSVVLPPVRILVHPEPLRVCYKYVHAVVPSFYDGYDNGREVDIVLHMGMSGPRPFYQLERRAHGRGYKIPDVDGQTPDYDDDDDDEGGGGEDGSFPDTLDSGLDIEDVHRRWTALCSVSCSPPFPCTATHQSYLSFLLDASVILGVCSGQLTLCFFACILWREK